VSVTKPATHDPHADVDALLYCPATHAVHVVPPVDDSVSVTEPAAHAPHADVETLLY
jgi:hypothetical protein